LFACVIPGDKRYVKLKEENWEHTYYIYDLSPSPEKNHTHSIIVKTLDEECESIALF
jgi:hypothetical protein